jgi:predicted TIM-barrel fold metal-dependent hydrolase
MTKISPIVDIHHHALLPKLTGAVKLGSVDIPSWAIDDSIAFMDKLGIDVAALTLTSPGIPFDDRGSARDIARRVNETLAGFVERHPKRILAMAALPLPDVDGALSELAYAIDVLKLDGVGVLSNYGAYFGTAHFEPLYAELNVRALPVHIHPTPPSLTADQDLGLPPSLYEYTFESTRVAAAVIYNDLFNRYPRLRFILSHAGGAVPFLAKRLSYGPQITKKLAQTAPADIIAELGKFYFDVAMTSARFTLPALNALVGAERILYGSDFPFMPTPSIIETTNDTFNYPTYADSDLIKIGSSNAIGLFTRLSRMLEAE